MDKNTVIMKVLPPWLMRTEDRAKEKKRVDALKAQGKKIVFIYK